ncbi:hypothetical protein ACFQZO_10910 [Bradyrhizobium sp. GCM10027634]|uniref:glucosamine inositolphosphorylceramide transferase family protein n=1 Tax=unclassified Bradyrhizobium TaxID=2631580 RepID=UPI00263BB265|nr:hypothetical protein [Bradyrhizobium sp. WYCCWR 12677]MDN5001393.1 hypothetical protein [Bradyrhizobium sp. WYCCWR 12677]
MRVCLYLDPSRLLRWHQWLAEALAERRENEVFCAFAAKRHPLPSIYRLLIDLERLVYGFGVNGATDPFETELRSLPSFPVGNADTIINLCGEVHPAKGGRVLTPLFNGVPGELGVLAAIANDEDLVIELHDSASPSGSWTARPARGDRNVFAAGLDSALSCAIALILKALHSEAALDVFNTTWVKKTQRLGAFSVLAFATSAAAAKAIKFVDLLARGGKTWVIAWRFDEKASLLEKGEANFRVVASQANGFLADPFPFEHQGRHFIFFEQYLNSERRGCIAVATADEKSITAPQIVVEETHHLSYPFVFEHDGQIWMIPESGAARSVTLYRAVEFPHRWTREACLTKGIELYDITPLQHQGGFWFFGTPRAWASTSWDALSIYSAENLSGMWTPHVHNPLLIDAAAGRSAGAFVQHGGRTLRPAQDCSRYYGAAVTFFQIDVLDRLRFVQTPVGRVATGALGCHTYNRHAGLEVLDLFGHVAGLREATASYGPITSRSTNAHGQAPVGLSNEVKQTPTAIEDQKYGRCTTDTL